MEIEVKFKVDSFDDVLEKMDQLGAKFKESAREVDIYFTPFTKREVLRVRHADGVKILTYKQLVQDDETQSAIEIEAKVDGDIESILEHVGHKPVIKKSKTRSTYSLGKVSINLDVVEGLGSFVELEFLGDQEDGEQELRRVASLLGFSWGDRVTTPYIKQLLDRNQQPQK